MNDTVKTPLEYARGRGWTAFPVAVYWNEEKKKHEKKPLTQHGHKNAVPAYSLQDCQNFGIPTGTANNLILLDFDMPTSKPELLKMFPSLDLVTVGQKTPSGGEHLLFYSTSTEIKNGTGVFGIEGFDVRGNGGWLASGEGYEITEPDAEIEDLPEDVVKALEEWSAKPAHEQITRDRTGRVGQGNRDNYLTSRAGGIIKDCATLDQFTLMLLGVNQMECSPPKDNKACLRIAHSIWGREGKPEQRQVSSLQELAMTLEKVERIQSTEFYHAPLIARGMVNVIIAPPNAGKSTLGMHLAKKFTDDGKKVLYLHPDGSDLDALTWKKYPAYPYIQPHEEQISCEYLFKMVCQEANDTIIFFDTIKWFTDVGHKASLKKFLSDCKLLCSQERGNTVVLLGHVNKYNGNDGEYIYEGTNEIHTNTDNGSFLYFREDEGHTTVTTAELKHKRKVGNVTYQIDVFRHITEVDYDPDVVVESKRAHTNDATIIQQINEALDEGCRTVTKLREKIGHRRIIERLFNDHASEENNQQPGDIWYWTRGVTREKRYFKL